MELSYWFVVLNIITSCFGLVYYFTQASAACKTCSKLHKAFVLLCFASSGITMFLSFSLLFGLDKYAEMFLFFSWFTVVLSAYFLKRPHLPEIQKPEPKTAPADNNQPSNVLMMPVRKGSRM